MLGRERGQFHTTKTNPKFSNVLKHVYTGARAPCSVRLLRNINWGGVKWRDAGGVEEMGHGEGVIDNPHGSKRKLRLGRGQKYLGAELNPKPPVILTLAPCIPRCATAGCY